jgi:hypothetical protein
MNLNLDDIPELSPPRVSSMMKVYKEKESMRELAEI